MCVCQGTCNLFIKSNTCIFEIKIFPNEEVVARGLALDDGGCNGCLCSQL